MAEIGMLLPKQTVLDCANRVIEKENRKVRLVKLVGNSNAVEAAREAVEEGIQILIARGFQASRIKENVGVPVVEISLTVQEIGLLVRKIKRRLGKEHPTVAIVHSENMFRNTDRLEELFDFTLHTYFLKNMEETDEKVDQAIREGADIIVGGVTANNAALERGFPAMFAETSEDSIRTALNEAESMGRILDMEHINNAQLATILDTSYNGIIKLNSSMEIVAANRMIEEILGMAVTDLAGMPLEQVFPEIDKNSVAKILGGEQELFYGSLTSGDRLMLVTGAPIRFEQGVGGAILTFQKVKRSMQGPERRGLPERSIYSAKGNFSMIQRGGPAMEECMELARSYACSFHPILIYGEVGTEKELLASAIHNNSFQKDGPFFRINCGALSEEEQEKLFSGTYNGRKRIWEEPGILQQNPGGTIYLHGIENLSRKCQHLLVETVENQSCWNGTAMMPAGKGGRILADTSVELKKLLSGGYLIPELYYALSLRLELPPLRQNKKEIQQLAHSYLNQYLKQYSKYIELDPEAYGVLQEYCWEGNLEQLRHFCECLVLSARRRKVRAGLVREMLEKLYSTSEYYTTGTDQTQTEEEQIIQALNQCGGNKVEAAKLLGISPTTLWRRMNKYSISKKYDGC